MSDPRRLRLVVVGASVPADRRASVHTLNEVLDLLVPPAERLKVALNASPVPDSSTLDRVEEGEEAIDRDSISAAPKGHPAGGRGVLARGLGAAGMGRPGAGNSAVTASDSPADPVAAGSVITYTIHVTNGGPATARSVSFSDATPTNTTLRRSPVRPAGPVRRRRWAGPGRWPATTQAWPTTRAPRSPSW